ncbi:GGDEF domain-containing protein [Massilia sp. PAMC28688]|uniref:sensor domain-containing diguanylate cyclase n=1 Tax=Massilia sp. PAMC28688 TaxID=2861283 RepID=UPI001C635AAD|nr:sensor domain-containing diguanylate cyclase [Massilia sp. PAMC28688]QYF92086.1 GGDEF domain-containing protein [Massilia sp. PAMC28688]
MGDSDTTRLGVLEDVLDAVNLGIIGLDEQGRVVLWNSWMDRHATHRADAVLGQDFFATFPALKGKRIEGAVRQALRDNLPSLLSQTLHKAPFELYSSAAAAASGERMQQAVAVTPLSSAGAGRLCLIQITDVSVAVHREQLLRDQALELRSQTFSDGLTGIANRRHFDVAMDKEIRRAKRAGTPLSLLMLDIDSFKAYNDHYGHQQGDACLVRVATALAAMLQRPLDLIARYGGEEFAVILPEMDAEQSVAMAEAMRRKIVSLNIAHDMAGHADHVTISVGVATRASGEDGADTAALLGAADRALYAAKHAGRNCVVLHAVGPAPGMPGVPGARGVTVPANGPV